MRNASFLHPHFKDKTVDPRTIHHQSNVDNTHFVSGTHGTQPMANMPNMEDRVGSAFPQTQFPVYPGLPSVCDAVHQKPSPVRRSLDPSVTLTMSATQGAWSEASTSSNASMMDSQFWSRTASKGHQPENYLPLNAPDQNLIMNKEKSEGKQMTFYLGLIERADSKSWLSLILSYSAYFRSTPYRCLEFFCIFERCINLLDLVWPFYNAPNILILGCCY